MTTDNTHSLLQDLGWLRTLACRLARDQDLAEDLVQDACALALAQPTPPRQWRAWLTTVVQNLLHRHRRAETLRRDHQRDAERGQPGDSTAALLQRAEAQQTLATAVLQLEEPYRSTVLLRFFEGLPPRRIAARQGVPVATVHSRLQRSLQQLRERLDHSLHGRNNWLVAFSPFAWPTLTSPASVGFFVMQAKLKVLAAAAAIACTAPLWWPDGADGSAPIAASTLRDGNGPGVSGTSGAGGGNAGPARTERTAATPTAAHTTPVMPHFTARGRVCDCSGTALPDVLVGVAGATANTARSDQGGNFALDLSTPTASLTATEDRFVTVMAAQWSNDATIAPVVVVASAVSFAGRVVESDGTPVPLSQIVLQLPDDFDSRFHVPLDRTGRGRWQTKAAADGSFALPRLPFIDGATLVAAAEAFAPKSMPLPKHDDANLQIVLQRFHFAAGELLGRVFDAAGAPASGARVAMGVTSVVTDRQGCFGIHLRRAGWPTAIVAAKAGTTPARYDVPRNGGKQRSDWPEEVVLRLGPAPQSVRGRVIDQDRKGIEKAEVWISDPTALGIAGMLPLQLEYLIAGGEVPPQASRMRVPHADDPTREGSFTTQAGHAPEPTASWFFVRTDAAGNFELPGLLERTYTLRALDPSTGIFGENGAVTGGSYQEIMIRRDGPMPGYGMTPVWPELRGRVISRSGRPIAGVAVQQQMLAYHVDARVPGGRFEGKALRAGRSTTTAADGTFVLCDVGNRFCTFAFSGDPIVPTQIAAEAVVDPLQCTVTVQARCHVEVVLLDPTEADEVACVDGEGQGIDLAVLRRNSNQFETELTLHNGRSGLFVVGERAAKLVLRRGGRLVREIAITPDPTRTTTVQ